MAIYQKGSTYGKMQLREGARGQMTADGRINRSNHTLNTSAHEATNIKYGLDDRLKREFIYGYGAGYNQMIVTKGRIAAVDPYLEIFDADTQKLDNALTLANGGIDVEFDKTTGHWKATNTAFVLDPATNKDTTRAENCRPANVPIGIFIRNEYTRDIDAFNGITPGAIETNCMAELPYFLDGAKAKENPWGSAYGALKPGDLIKSDETGRFTLSPLSDATWLSAEGRTAGQIELERQQVIGQVYEVRKELVPMGAAKYAQWALSDILEFEEFNPDIKRKTNRRGGEDNIENTAYQTDGKAPFGFEPTLAGEHDLHSMNGISKDPTDQNRTAYNKRMQHRYRFDFGIPGLTDGYNAVRKVKTQVETLPKLKAGEETIVRLLDTNIEVLKDGTIITLDGTVTLPNGSIVESGTGITGGTAIKGPVAIAAKNIEITFIDAMQGLMKIKATADLTTAVELNIAFNKRGEAGVPTKLDWDGCVGTVKILLQK